MAIALTLQAALDEADESSASFKNALSSMSWVTRHNC